MMKNIFIIIVFCFVGVGSCAQEKMTQAFNKEKITVERLNEPSTIKSIAISDEDDINRREKEESITVTHITIYKSKTQPENVNATANFSSNDKNRALLKKPKIQTKNSVIKLENHSDPSSINATAIKVE